MHILSRLVMLSLNRSNPEEKREKEREERKQKENEGNSESNRERRLYRKEKSRVKENWERGRA